MWGRPVADWELRDPLFLIVAVLAPLVYVLAARTPAALTYSSLVLVDSAPRSQRARFAKLPAFLLAAAALSLAVALAGPRTGNATSRIHREGIAIAMVVDRSGSMQARDFVRGDTSVSRLDVVKEVFRKFVTGKGEGSGRSDDLVGLVVFARYADGLSPLTLDHGNLLSILADVEIAFERRDEPVSPSIPNPDAPSAAVSHDGATISVYRDAITPSGITHELLHIYRYWAEAVPQVMPIKGADTMNWRTTSSIENALEHLVIVPREETYGVYDEEFWNKISRTFWDKYPWPGNDYPWSRRKDCLLGWLSCMEIVTDEAVRDLAKDCIDQEGYLSEAIKFHEKIMRVLLDKPRALSTVMRFLPIPFTDVLLVTFDIRKRKRICAELPSY